MITSAKKRGRPWGSLSIDPDKRAKMKPLKLVEPRKLPNKLSYARDDETRYDLMEDYLDTVPSEWAKGYDEENWKEALDDPEIPWKHREVQHYTSGLDELYDEKIHALFDGVTGSGKTTLLLSILRVFLDRGDFVLHRDDGKLEFKYLAYLFPDDTRVFIPRDKNCELTMYGMKEVEIVRFDPHSPQDIINRVYDWDYKFNVVIYDPYSRPGPEGWKMKSEFYSMLFEHLLLKVQGMRSSKKRHLIFSIDELNDLIPPRGKGTMSMGLTAAIDNDIRKLRGHNIQLFGTTHRFNQISIDTRSQMKNIFMKQAYGYDAYTFLAHNLITSSSKTFWGLLKKVSRMPKHIYLLFDQYRNFDMCSFPDIPRPHDLDCECTGTLSLPLSAKKINFRRAHIAYLIGKGLSKEDVLKKLNESGKYGEVEEYAWSDDTAILREVNIIS